MTQAQTMEKFGPVFDADNHYWEASDAFTRHREPKFRERGVQVREVDGVMRYVIDGQTLIYTQGPADVHPRPEPGAFLGYFVGNVKATKFREAFEVEPATRPEWYNRDQRLKIMDAQGVEAAWMFPSQGVILEAPMLATGDVEATMACMRAFNRWVDDEWGFAYKNRIFGVPYMTLSDPENAVAELKWAIERGARVVHLRHGPAVTRDGLRSPAHPMFDTFWGLAEEAGIVVSVHAGADRSYLDIHETLRNMYGERPDGSAIQMTPDSVLNPSIFSAMTRGRVIHDFAFVLVAHRLFERFPKLRVAFVENGSAWVPSLLQALEYLDHSGEYVQSPKQQFIDHCWVVPFPEDNLDTLARCFPANRIMFGSDWPHGEGLAHPTDFFEYVKDFSAEDQRRIMYDNVRELTFA